MEIKQVFIDTAKAFEELTETLKLMERNETLNIDLINLICDN